MSRSRPLPGVFYVFFPTAHACYQKFSWVENFVTSRLVKKITKISTPRKFPAIRYDFTLQMNAFVASDEIVSATHLQIRITLPTNMFIVSDERILCWRRTLLMLEANAFHAGDEHFSAGHERIEPARSSFSHTHTATCSYQ